MDIILQPLDVGLFGPLSKVYGEKFTIVKDLAGT
jgi:hypothetical protein